MPAILFLNLISDTNFLSRHYNVFSLVTTALIRVISAYTLQVEFILLEICHWMRDPFPISPYFFFSIFPFFLKFSFPVLAPPFIMPVIHSFVSSSHISVMSSPSKDNPCSSLGTASIVPLIFVPFFSSTYFLAMHAPSDH